MIPWGAIFEQLPTLLRAIAPFIPLIAEILKRIPTSKTDRMEAKARKFHDELKGKTVREIASLGRQKRVEARMRRRRQNA